jgi:hypothetical protein
MSLDQASLIAQIISAIAIVASLIFVGIQLRQAAQAVRNSSSQAHSAVYSQINSVLTNNGEFAAIWRRALANPADLAEDEWVRFVAHLSSLFRFFESSRVQWLRGQLDEEHWQTILEQVRSLGAQPGVQAWWQLRGWWHSKEFQTWFEGLKVDDMPELYLRRGQYGRPNADSSKGGSRRASGPSQARS